MFAVYWHTQGAIELWVAFASFQQVNNGYYL